MTSARPGDGGGSEFQRVSDLLHSRIADGTYPLDQQLPTQRELRDELGVSRDTVQRVMKELVSEGLVRSRQGSGSRVVKTQTAHSSSPRSRGSAPVTLGPIIGAAFAQPQVTLDVFTLTSESLDAHIRLQAERVRAGEAAPEGIGIRMMLPSRSIELPYPRALRDPADRRPVERLHDITARHSASLRQALRDLETEGFVSSARLEVREVPLTPAFKLYLLNGSEALQGHYEVVERSIMLDDGEEVDALDVLGLGAALTHHVVDEGNPESQSSLFVASAQRWFDSCWDRLAEGAGDRG